MQLGLGGDLHTIAVMHQFQPKGAAAELEYLEVVDVQRARWSLDGLRQRPWRGDGFLGKPITGQTHAGAIRRLQFALAGRRRYDCWRCVEYSARKIGSRILDHLVQVDRLITL